MEKDGKHNSHSYCEISYVRRKNSYLHARDCKYSRCATSMISPLYTKVAMFHAILY
jgi:hypothetical protein